MNSNDFISIISAKVNKINKIIGSELISNLNYTLLLPFFHIIPSKPEKPLWTTTNDQTQQIPIVLNPEIGVQESIEKAFVEFVVNKREPDQ